VPLFQRLLVVQVRVVEIYGVKAKFLLAAILRIIPALGMSPVKLYLVLQIAESIILFAAGLVSMILHQIVLVQ
jgi:hypothetical protein